jgi:hypothetical protein
LDVVHVGAGDLVLLVGDDLLHPARIEIDEVAGAAAEVGEVLDGEPEPARAGRTDHQPGAAAREMLVGDLAGKLLVVGLVVVPADALLRHAGGPAGLEDVVGPALVLLRHPDLGLQVAQRLVLEVREAHQVGEALDFGGGVPAGFLRPIEPERAAALG